MLDHLIVENIEDDIPDDTIEEVLRFGAAELFAEELNQENGAGKELLLQSTASSSSLSSSPSMITNSNGGGGNNTTNLSREKKYWKGDGQNIVYDDAAVTALLDRSKAIETLNSNTMDDDESSSMKPKNAFSLAKVWTVTGFANATDVFDNNDMPDDHDKPNTEDNERNNENNTIDENEKSKEGKSLENGKETDDFWSKLIKRGEIDVIINQDPFGGELPERKARRNRQQPLFLPTNTSVSKPLNGMTLNKELNTPSSIKEALNKSKFSSFPNHKKKKSSRSHGSDRSDDDDYEYKSETSDEMDVDESSVVSDELVSKLNESKNPPEVATLKSLDKHTERKTEKNNTGNNNNNHSLSVPTHNLMALSTSSHQMDVLSPMIEGTYTYFLQYDKYRQNLMKNHLSSIPFLIDQEHPTSTRPESQVWTLKDALSVTGTCFICDKKDSSSTTTTTMFTTAAADKSKINKTATTITNTVNSSSTPPVTSTSSISSSVTDSLSPLSHNPFHCPIVVKRNGSILQKKLLEITSTEQNYETFILKSRILIAALRNAGIYMESKIGCGYRTIVEISSSSSSSSSAPSSTSLSLSSSVIPNK